MKVDASRHGRIAALVAIAIGIATPALTFADDAADRKTEAQRLFAEGQAALDAGDNSSGCALMRTSLELFAVANSLFNVAQCDERDGKVASSLEHWQRGMLLIDATDKRLPVVKKAIEDLELRVPRVRIVVSPNNEPLDVLLDDKIIAKDTLEAAMFIDPGKHTITFRKAGYEDHRVDIVLNERERTEVVAELGVEIAVPIPTISATVAPPPPPRMPPMKVGGFVALGVGGLGLLGAAITGGVISSQHSEIASQCPQKVCTEKGRSLIQSQETLLPLNAVFWGMGIAGAAAGTVMLVMSARAGKDSKTPVVAPLILHNGGGIGLSGRF